eukprot:gene10241-11291_t
MLTNRFVLSFQPSEYITGFDTRTGKEVTQITFTSDRIKDEYDPGDNNGNRVMSMSHPTGEGAKALELWDLSGLKKNRIQLLGRFLPETDLRFSHMTTDERCVVTGMTGTEELVFLRMCGDERKLERQWSMDSKAKQKHKQWSMDSKAYLI